jgi:hypothetical protein
MRRLGTYGKYRALQRSLEALSGHDSYIDFESCVVVYSWSSKMIQSGIDVITLFSSDEPRAVSANTV